MALTNACNYDTTSNTILTRGPASLEGSCTAVGFNALSLNTTGANNTAIGAAALQNNTTGQLNTAVGNLALQTNTVASNLTALGSSALANNLSGTNNVAVGTSALSANLSGSQNTALGVSALGAITIGSSCSALGYNAGAAYTTGESDNISIGAGVIGAAGESAVTRIGATATMARCFVGGIYGTISTAGTVSAPVVIDPVGQIGTVGPLTNGQLLIGSTGLAPVAATLSPGSNITITNSAGGITIAAAGGVSSIALFGNTGSATGLAGTVSVIGDPMSITTAGEPGGNGSSLTISLVAPVLVSYGGTGRQSITSRTVLLGAGTSPVSVSNVGSNGTVLIAGGAGNDPAFATITSTGRSLTYTTSVNGFNLDINAPVVVSYGGTGQQTLTSRAVLLGAGTSPVSVSNVGSNGTVLIAGGTGNDPAFATITSTGRSLTYTTSVNGFNLDINAPVVVSYGGTGNTTLTSNTILIGSGTSPITQVGPLTNGQLLIGSTGLAPVAATLSPGSGINIANSAGGITIGGLNWSTLSSNLTASSNSAYVITSGSVSLGLPTISILGSLFNVLVQSGTVAITQAASQSIQFGGTSTTTGTGGNITSSNAGNTLTLACVTANTQWMVYSVQGNWLVT